MAANWACCNLSLSPSYPEQYFSIYTPIPFGRHTTGTLTKWPRLFRQASKGTKTCCLTSFQRPFLRNPGFTKSEFRAIWINNGPTGLGVCGLFWKRMATQFSTVWFVDQAALHGLLKKVRDLGLPLVSVNRTEGGKLITRNQE